SLEHPDRPDLGPQRSKCGKLLNKQNPGAHSYSDCWTRQILSTGANREAGGLAAEERAGGGAGLSEEFRCGDFLAVLVLRLEDLDPPPLGSDEEALGADFGDLADFSLHGAEGAHEVLAAVEDLDFLAVERGPRAGRGIAAADQVVDEIDVGRPV